MTPKFELGRYFCTMHLPLQVSSSYVYSFTSYCVEKQTNKHTHKHTNEQTPLKTSNTLRYATTLGNNQTKFVSAVKAPASLNSALVSTQYMRCGDGRDHGAGRLTIVRRMYSFPTAGGNSLTAEWLNVELWLDSRESESSSDDDIVDCFTVHTHIHSPLSTNISPASMPHCS